MLRRTSLAIALCIASAVAAHGMSDGMSAGRPFSPAGRTVIPVLYLNTDFLAANAGKTMTEVTQAVARVTDIMGEIAAASKEQSRGIGQVNQAVTQMDQVTQQNAALVEEAAAASRSLEDQGQQLTQAIGFFHMDKTSSGKTGSRTPASARPANGIRAVKNTSPAAAVAASVATSKPPICA